MPLGALRCGNPFERIVAYLVSREPARALFAAKAVLRQGETNTFSATVAPRWVATAELTMNSPRFIKNWRRVNMNGLRK